MKTYKINEILPALNLNDYQSKNLTEIIKVSEQVNHFYPCEVMLNFSEYDNSEHYENADIKMIYKGIIFYIKYWEYRKKFVIYEDTLRTFSNIDSYTIKSIKEKIKEPQQIGVLNLKKLINWFEYHISVINEASKLNDINGNEKETFLKSIEGLPVKWWNNGKNGEIIQNGIKFSFNIGETYISKKIEVHYSVNNELENFLKLAQNKYTQIN
jgi:hypothetical protein